MDTVYIFIKCQNTLSLQCLQTSEIHCKAKILNLEHPRKIILPTDFQKVYEVFFPHNSSRPHYLPAENEIIKVEFQVLSTQEKDELLALLKSKFLNLIDAEAFPSRGTLKLSQDAMPPVKVVPDSAISRLFNTENITFTPEINTEPLFPKSRLTSDHIKQTDLGECAFAAIITGFCIERPYTIYNCMRDNFDGSVLVRFFSADPTPEPCFYLIQKSKLKSSTSGSVLTKHFLWAHILLKAYAFHKLHLHEQSRSSQLPTIPAQLTIPEPPKLKLMDFLRGFIHIELAHALTGEGETDFFNNPNIAPKIRCGNLIEDGIKYYQTKNLPIQPTLALLSEIKRLCCPLELSAKLGHYNGAQTRFFNGQTIYTDHAYYVLKVEHDSITVLNPWQHVTTTDGDQHKHHLLYSIHHEHASSLDAASSSSSPIIQHYKPLYDADAENYKGAITLNVNEIELAFNTICACKVEKLWNCIKNEIVKIIQAFIQFSGYHSGLAAILQRIFLNHLPNDVHIENLSQIVKELYDVAQLLPCFHLPNNPIKILACVLNSFLPDDKRSAMLAAIIPPQLKDFNQAYNGEFTIVHTSMNALYAPYCILFQILHRESLTSYNLRDQLVTILNEFELRLSVVLDLNIQMYGETLLTYAANISFSYADPLRLYKLVERILAKNPSLVKKNAQKHSPLMSIFKKASKIVLDCTQPYACNGALALARQIIQKLRENNTPENNTEIEEIIQYLKLLSPMQRNKLLEIYERTLELDINNSAFSVSIDEAHARTKILNEEAINRSGLLQDADRQSFTRSAIAAHQDQSEKMLKKAAVEKSCIQDMMVFSKTQHHLTALKEQESLKRGLFLQEEADNRNTLSRLFFTEQAAKAASTKRISEREIPEAGRQIPRILQLQRKRQSRPLTTMRQLSSSSWQCSQCLVRYPIHVTECSFCSNSQYCTRCNMRMINKTCLKCGLDLSGCVFHDICD